MCPLGWKIFEEGKGRTIIGSGTIEEKVFNFGDQDGKISEILEIDQIPEHKHLSQVSYYCLWGRGKPDYSVNIHYVDTYLIDSRALLCKTSPVGNKKETRRPIELMNPYVALTWCIKE